MWFVQRGLQQIEAGSNPGKIEEIKQSFHYFGNLMVGFIRNWERSVEI